MANTITSQTIVDGDRLVIVKINILGDGSGEETGTVIFDASAYTPATTNNKLMRIDYGLAGFAASLEWDSTANAPLLSLPADYSDFKSFDVCECSIPVSGIPNNGGAGRTGDILITTVGLGAGDTGHIILYLYKLDVPVTR